MPFQQRTRINLLVKSARRCCVCLKFCGTKIEVDHIIQEADGGPNDEENGIPLCFDCHADVHSYNKRHPRGTKFQPEELRKHKERLFRWVEQGPIILDSIGREVLVMEKEALYREEEQPPPFPLVDLQHDAKVARYKGYIRSAEKAKDQRLFGEAAQLFEAAFSIAESDACFKDYASGGHYYYRKILFWQCLLELNIDKRDEEIARTIFNMAMDENSISALHQQDGPSGDLTHSDYFYLLLQEKTFLFDDRIRERIPLEKRLNRIRDLMYLIEDPHRVGLDQQLLGRAHDLEREIREQLAEIAPGIEYSRP
ncbi:MAG: HNH endonuclease signature motif containing protein (plasmid) [Candidatus Manganitrophus sp.]|nr:HNH endonuclease signature motif containing protein [Candidatus Manganitrophus sp.]MDC4228122.1 HNH endonuclease signature motif containing protein [Candidatus Manganitrophus sp.]WDT73630.1 MAG: HNH endonuclease signature motif containing protein [Candidatus Manganitrophus sp.]WDT77857.1 MAG: HNH endonuclease signature motif containing protein [Candidatus Manganitrophus sp.]WDT82705.1 MAG: HNH endonuclease signature motif containing protein [Candidatus Manganitrophus sp.]